MYVNLLTYNALDKTTKTTSHQVSGSPEDVIQLTIGLNKYTFTADGKLINVDVVQTNYVVSRNSAHTCAVFSGNPTYTYLGETKPLSNSNIDD